jgi:DNA-binding transcriptional MerR regulator
METGLTIQQVAKLTGLSIDTLRYYERIGLLEPVGRAQNGYRHYTQHDLAWIDLLIRLRDTGMPRAQMVRFAQLRRQGSATATERRLMLEQHQRSLEQHMQELEQHMAALQQKIARIQELEAQRDAASHSAHAFGQSETDVSASDPETKQQVQRSIFID